MERDGQRVQGRIKDAEQGSCCSTFVKLQVITKALPVPRTTSTWADIVNPEKCSPNPQTRMALKFCFSLQFESMQMPKLKCGQAHLGINVSAHQSEGHKNTASFRTRKSLECFRNSSDMVSSTDLDLTQIFRALSDESN
jgi:hypothetical protein